MEAFWNFQQVVPRHNGFQGTAFPYTSGTTQEVLVSPTLFTVVVYNVVRTWLSMTVEDHRVTHDGLGETVGRCLGVFYAEYGMVGSHDPDWLQNVMNFLVGLFRRYGLEYNVVKSRTMT